MTDPVLDADFDPLADAVRERDRVVRPKHAATLILVRSDAPAPRLLMGRRAGGHAFMPSKWVFPGGRIERADWRAASATELRPEVAEKVGARARPLAMAAVRETFEEAGLMLAKRAEPQEGPGAWAEFTRRGALPHLASLTYVARAITPPYRAKRFDARFFMADAGELISLERLPDCGELDEIAWVSLPEALELDLPSITRFVVNEVGKRLTDPARPVPFVRMERGARKLDWL
ncbi:MAG TPA: NUDIX hydrolase [Caulobacteraceae bacterium]|jgi:8-oxo-dGTP pyrophosphatase MutT (NUDIX family)